MADFKVVFRNERGADGGIGWEAGCPLTIDTVQVSRNTETGECWLQVKVSNASGAVVSRFNLATEVLYADGSVETVETSPLDADIVPGGAYRCAPVLLTASDIRGARARILNATCGGSRWASSVEPVPVPQGEPLNLDSAASREQARILREKRKDPTAYDTKVVEGDGWWVCPCGSPNVARDTCRACGMSKAELLQLEDEDRLHEKAEVRAQAETAARRKKKRLAIIFSALGVVAVVAAALAINQFVVQPQMEIAARPSCYLPSQITLYSADKPYAVSRLEVDQNGNIVSVNYTDPDDKYESLGYFSIDYDENGFPLEVRAFSAGSYVYEPDEKTSPSTTNTLTVNQLSTEGLPLSVTVNASDGKKYEYTFDYYTDGTLKAVNSLADATESQSELNEYGFMQGSSASDENGSYQYQISYEGGEAGRPSKRIIDTTMPDGQTVHQEETFEYNDEGLLEKVYINGALSQEFSYTFVEHANPWAFAIAQIKPFTAIFF